MAVKLKFLGVVVPIATIRRLEAEGRVGLPTCLEPGVNGLNTDWWDEHLYIATAMNWIDGGGELRFWEDHGLTLIEYRGGEKRWKDVCAVASGRGPTLPCDWIEYDPTDNTIFLRGTDKGEVFGPQPWKEPSGGSETLADLLLKNDVEVRRPWFVDHRIDRFRVRIDQGRARYRIGIGEDLAYDESDREPQLHPRISRSDAVDFVPAGLLAHKAKVFDDRLYAAVERAAQRGAGSFSGKTSLLLALASAPSAPTFLRAALQLGGSGPGSKSDPDVDRCVAAFMSDERRSKPIGFYAQSPDLEAIFRQDRLLQSELEEPDAIRSIAALLSADRSLRSTYEAYLGLVSTLTNPPAYPDFRALLPTFDPIREFDIPHGLRFLPPSISHESELARRLVGDRPVPEGFNLIEELIQRIRSGEILLAPKPSSGWYDYQTWALEPLIVPDRMPEAAVLETTREYRNELASLFKGLMALTRETHAKQLEVTTIGAFFRVPSKPEVDVSPDFCVEPIPEYYRRRAIGYRFVRKALESVFGEGALSDLPMLAPGGSTASSIAFELNRIEGIFYGAFVQTGWSMGLDVPELREDTSEGRPRACVQTFLKWMGEIPTDLDVGEDVRCMVPVYYDVERRRLKAWCVLGWVQRPLGIQFIEPPPYEILDDTGAPVAHDTVDVKFKSLKRTLTYPMAIEVHVKRLLDREEFQSLCDKHRTLSAIVKALQ